MFATKQISSGPWRLLFMMGLMMWGVVGAFSLDDAVPQSATFSDAIALPALKPVNAPVETVYPEPRGIVWEGHIIATLSGGRGIAVRRADVDGAFQAYFAEGVASSISEGPVLISGLLTSVSCAYAETIFSGLCTPVVEITAIDQLPIELE